MCICKMEVAMSFLILVSDMTIAMDCDEEASITKESS